MHGFEKWKLQPIHNHMYISKGRKKEGEREREIDRQEERENAKKKSTSCI